MKDVAVQSQKHDLVTENHGHVLSEPHLAFLKLDKDLVQ
jgi:hypothetical protein